MAKQPPRSNASETSSARPARAKRTKAAPAADSAAAPPERAAEIGSATGAITKPESAPASETRTMNAPPEAIDERRSVSMSSAPSEEDIRLRAYHRYLERGGGHGMDFEDWLEAERELKTNER